MNDDATTPFRCRSRTLDFSLGAKVMGILNTTPDSFHDGGTLASSSGGLDLERALERARRMLREGADILDIGGESTRPGAETVGTPEEIRRTAPLIRLLRRETDAVISIDTYKAEVAEAALEAGADLVNDISGFSFDGAMAGVCRRYGAAAVLMHTAVRPAEMQWSTGTTEGEGDIVRSVREFLAEAVRRAEDAGVPDTIVDPGFGFGKSVRENFELLRRLGELRAAGRPILAGLSRKSFLGKVSVPEGEAALPTGERLPATISAETLALVQGADIIRAHDVREARACVMVVRAMREGAG
ncbi:dihydropteroate synthase [Chlorobium sp. N1]|uniref:dihydropteroate synthase n=1 Tax=Chlorobium sp. N1 TaxID=2491138 RepID=UPI00103B888B|nr:dihydropteroate synthase [Chlorobium sp. N1]TCD48800.1 dihydropteroate synthase [Chlorobium sp. N1]